MTRRGRILLVSALVLLLGFAEWYQYAGGVPEGQEPLTPVGTASLDAVAEEFNRASDQMRIVLLLSPT